MTEPSWHFISTHGFALLAIAHTPDATLHDLGQMIGVTERAAFTLVDDLVEAGFVIRTREGRRNRYRIDLDKKLLHRLSRARTVGELIGLFGAERSVVNLRAAELQAELQHLTQETEALRRELDLVRAERDRVRESLRAAAERLQ
jgi:DNA-binding MarR family transcriptional regulator